MIEQMDYSVDFYITQYRKMFMRIIIIYILILISLGYIFYQLSNIKEPVYYAASESGLLRKLDAWNERDLRKFVRSSNNSSNK
jgi:hypothetical protein